MPPAVVGGERGSADEGVLVEAGMGEPGIEVRTAHEHVGHDPLGDLQVASHGNELVHRHRDPLAVSTTFRSASKGACGSRT